MGSLLMSEMRRSGTWHFRHTVSIPNTRRRRSDHLMYFALPSGLFWSPSGGVAAGGPGTTSFRQAACEESTPEPRFAYACPLRRRKVHSAASSATANRSKSGFDQISTVRRLPTRTLRGGLT
jgi:hypothetical protein